MYNINYKKYHKELIVGFILVIIGILLTSLYMNYVFKGAFRKLFLDSEVKAIQINENKKDDLYSLVYIFEVNNKKYYCEVDNASKIKPDKKEIMVYYDSNNPNNCVNEYEATPSIYSYVILFFPMFSIALGLFVIVFSLSDIRKLNKLEKNGTLIKNVIYKVEEVEIKRRKFIKVISVDYKLTDGKVAHLISDIPKKDIEILGYIDLLIDVDNINNFYIDFNLKNIDKDNKNKLY